MSDGLADSVDVLVIGAGYAGLSAALELVERGLSVTVLEAADRVGGRTQSGRTLDGQWLELGGQWVGPAHHRLRRLIDRFGLTTEPTAKPGRTVSLSAGGRVELESNSAATDNLTPEEADDVRDAVNAFASIVELVEMDAPWNTEGAMELDEQTFAGWIRSTLSTTAGRDYFTTSCEAIFAPDPLEVSLLHAAYYFKSGDHIDALLGVDRESQEERVTGGASMVCDAMAAELGARVIVGEPIRAISQVCGAGSRDHVVAVARSGRRYTGSKVIVTLPPPLAARLEYSPIMPSARDQLTQRLHAISVVKLYLVYDRPFWRDAGLSGEGIIQQGPIKVVLDNTPAGYSRALLVGFIEGSDKIGFSVTEPEQRRAAFIQLAVQLFGESAAQPLEYIERDWTMEEFARGCYSGHFAPGTWVNYGPALTAPVGLIHWAGTETATAWTGYMEGAIQSGLRAAREVELAIKGVDQ